MEIIHVQNICQTSSIFQGYKNGGKAWIQNPTFSSDLTPFLEQVWGHHAVWRRKERQPGLISTSSVLSITQSLTWGTYSALLQSQGCSPVVSESSPPRSKLASSSLSLAFTILLPSGVCPHPQKFIAGWGREVSASPILTIVEDRLIRQPLATCSNVILCLK